MAGIYIHIPFCKKRCLYCDFYSTTALEKKNDFLAALQKEIFLRRDFFPQGTPVETLYFGGGTPSLLHPGEVQIIVNCLRENFLFSPAAEITFEANPEDLNNNYLTSLLRTDINRLSLGIQSFSNSFLALLNRRHNARQAIDAVTTAATKGFNNISIDLIYGLPGQSLAHWKQDLQQAMNLPVSHLSAYHLAYEQGTQLTTLLKEGKIEETPEDLSLQMFKLLIERTAQHGFEHYELSNFARQGQYSRHNMAYWTGKPYLGLGPSAHSFDGEKRYHNTSHLEKYLQLLKDDKTAYESEILSATDRMNERIMLALRTSAGLDLKDFEQSFGKEKKDLLVAGMKKFTRTGLVLLDEQKAVLSTEGKFLSDMIIRDLFFERK